MGTESAIYDQVVSAWYTMMETAIDGENGTLYWSGALTNTLEKAGISKAKYSHITSYLKKMGCIERSRRGAGSVPSVWILWEEPSWEKFEAVKLANNSKGPGGRYSTKVSEQHWNDLNQRVSVIESQLGIGVVVIEDIDPNDEDVIIERGVIEE